jgi:hypothetical protein
VLYGSRGEKDKTMMDKKAQVEVLQLHSEHVRKLFTETSENLAKLVQTISEQKSPAKADSARLLSKLAVLQKTLTAETGLFCGRLKGFLEETETGNSPS